VGQLAFVTEDVSVYQLLEPLLMRWELGCQWFGSATSILDHLDDQDLYIALIDGSLSDMDPVKLCQQIVARRPDVRVIVTDARRNFDSAVAALRAGAFDYFAHPITAEEFDSAINRAMRQQALREQVQRLRQALAEARGFEELVGASPPMQKLYELLGRAARASASVLITGESGTGKELVARALHRRSSRREGPFVAVNCSALPEGLLESELFGHTRGAFTDARAGRSGLFVKASGGTIFLDEIGEMPISVQPKLLRALQERVVRPVGGDNETPFDARVIAATNRNLEAAVADKMFREDLFYRINVIHIDIPPLRERASDVLLIAQHFVEHYALITDTPVVGLSVEAAEKLVAYPWPGNIRELQNCIERAVSLTGEAEVQVDDLPDKVARYRPSHVLVAGDVPSELVTMEEVERRYIHRVLQAVRGNKREAARVLGFNRKTLYRKLERFGIVVEGPARASGQSPQSSPEELGPEELGPEELGPEELGPEELASDDESEFDAVASRRA